MKGEVKEVYYFTVPLLHTETYWYRPGRLLEILLVLCSSETSCLHKIQSLTCLFIEHHVNTLLYNIFVMKHPVI